MLRSENARHLHKIIFSHSPFDTCKGSTSHLTVFLIAVSNRVITQGSARILFLRHLTILARESVDINYTKR